MILSNANRINNGEAAIGFFQRLADGRMLICHVELTDEDSDDYLFGAVKYTEWQEIDPSTLKHSFDNGTTWHTEDEIKQALRFKRFWKTSDLVLENEALEAKSKSCEWGIDDDEYNIWKTSCGHGWQFTEGGEPSEHGMKFCLGCGKPIELLQQ